MDKPPSYSNLPPPTFEEATAADRAKAKKAGCARLTVACISTFMVCLCFAVFVLAIVFGFWMAQCHKTGSVSTLSLRSAFRGDGIKQATIKIDGGVSITPFTTLSSEIFTSILIASPKQNQNAPQDSGTIKANDSDYVIIRKKGFWRCSRYMAKVGIIDLPSDPSETSSAPASSSDAASLSRISLLVSSRAGDIQMQAFENRIFEGVEFEAQSGIAAIGGARVRRDLSVRSGGEGIGLFHSFANRITLVGGMTGISMANTSATNYHVATKKGNILTSTLFLLSSASLSPFLSSPSAPSESSSTCEALFVTSSGSIQIQALSFDPTSSVACRISISSKKGDITVNLVDFSGSYSVQASTGNAQVNSKACENGFCEGKVGIPGRVEHEVVIMNGQGNINFTFSE